MSCDRLAPRGVSPACDRAALALNGLLAGLMLLNDVGAGRFARGRAPPRARAAAAAAGHAAAGRRNPPRRALAAALHRRARRRARERERRDRLAPRQDVMMRRPLIARAGATAAARAREGERAAESFARVPKPGTCRPRAAAAVLLRARQGDGRLPARRVRAPVGLLLVPQPPWSRSCHGACPLSPLSGLSLSGMMLSPPFALSSPFSRRNPARSKFGDHGAGRAHRAVERVADALIACFAAFVPLAVAGFVRGEYDAWGDCSAEWPAWALPIFLALNTAISVAQSVIFLRPLFEVSSRERAVTSGGAKAGAKAEPQTRMGAAVARNAGAVVTAVLSTFVFEASGDRRARLARVRRAEGATPVSRALSLLRGGRIARAPRVLTRARATRAGALLRPERGRLHHVRPRRQLRVRMLWWVPVVVLCPPLLRPLMTALPPLSLLTTPLRGASALSRSVPTCSPLQLASASRRVVGGVGRAARRASVRVREWTVSAGLRRGAAGSVAERRGGARVDHEHGRPPRRRARRRPPRRRRAPLGARRGSSARAPRTRAPPPRRRARRTRTTRARGGARWWRGPRRTSPTGRRGRSERETQCLRTRRGQMPCYAREPPLGACDPGTPREAREARLSRAVVHDHRIERTLERARDLGDFLRGLVQLEGRHRAHGRLVLQLRHLVDVDLFGREGGGSRMKGDTPQLRRPREQRARAARALTNLCAGCCDASLAKNGAIFWHGPHHVAVKSTTTATPSACALWSSSRHSSIERTCATSTSLPSTAAAAARRPRRGARTRRPRTRPTAAARARRRRAAAPRGI